MGHGRFAMQGAHPQPPGHRLPGYKVETHTHRIGKHGYEVRQLADRRQYSDPDGAAERAGVSQSSWPIFGVPWPSGMALAEAMCTIPIKGLRILEVGCGLGLASLVLKRRGAGITASDYHPLAGTFLRHNTDLNGLAPIAFICAKWGGPDTGIGRFDLLIGADLLYERDHARLLADFLARHANDTARFMLADAGRGHCVQFNELMRLQGYWRTERRVSLGGAWPPGACGKILTYERVAGRAAASAKAASG